MILVDSSVWVEAFRKPGHIEAQRLGALLEADLVAMAVPVRIELLSGASKADRIRLRRLFSALPNARPCNRTWDLIDGWLDRAGEAGEVFAFADLLIAALAVEAGWRLWSKDGDFARMEALGLLECYRAED